MKKFLYLSAAIASALTLASCSSNDEPEMTPQKGVTFTVNLPADLQTRAGDFGNGTEATNLYYAVYDAKATTPTPLALIDGTDKTVGKTTFTNLKATVHLDLPKGPEFNIVFFACTDAENPEDNVYTFDANNAKFTVNYDNMNKNGYSEKNDCFSTTRANFKLAGPVTETITLYRPVAQLNIGASDFKQATAGTLNTAYTQVEINRLYSEFNFISGTMSEDGKCDKGAVTGEEAAYKFAMTAIPSDDEVFPYKPEGAEVTPYTYMSMNYVLIPTTKTVHNVSFGIDDTRYETAVFSNVPMQRNHRTNLFGNIFTSPADFEVVIDPNFDVPDYNYYDKATTDMLRDLAEGRPVVMTQDITLDSFPAMKDNNGKIDMNGFTLTVNDYGRIYGNVVIENGTYVPGKPVAFDMKNGGELTLNNVKGYAESTFVLIEPENYEWTGRVRLNGCELSGRDYCVATNASYAANMKDRYLRDYHIYVNNTKMSGCETPMLINVPIFVWVENNSELTGSWQAMVLRGGFAQLSNSKFTTTCQAQANTTTQGQGNQVPRAAITLLNGGAYEYQASVTADACEFNGNNNVPAVYALKKGLNKISVALYGSSFIGETVNFGADRFDINE